MVGLFLFVGLCLLAAMILKFGNFGDAFRSKYKIELHYASAGGVVKGTEVKFSGVTVGRVSAPPLPNDEFTGTVMELSIFDEYPIPDGSKISIESAGFLGDSYVAITPPKIPTNKYLANGEVVIGTPSGGLSALANSAGDISERGKEIVVDMRAALSELNSALSKLDGSILGEENLARFNETIAGLSEAVKNVNTDVLSEENNENLRVSLENFRKVSENFVKTSDNLIASSEKISPILDSAKGAVDKADEGIGEITSAARDAKVAIRRATEGDGLVAALINDAELRDDFEALISNLRSSGILRYRDSVAEPDKPKLTERKGLFRNR
jgi:phospholipid/cholesterol/gamma-HCH transport system substrate-binding protein